jgi:hypothetical protein
MQAQRLQPVVWRVDLDQEPVVDMKFILWFSCSR